jgi:hypothetical protein
MITAAKRYGERKETSSATLYPEEQLREVWEVIP